MILKFIRSVMGYVEFKVSGGYPEKFINLCVRDGNNLWDIRKINGDLFVKTHISEYKNLHKKARKSNSQIRIINRWGLPFFVNKYRSRLGILIGFVMFVLTIFIFSSLVWRVNIIGCKNMNPKEVEKVINDLGIYVGVPKYKIDIPKIKQKVMMNLENISWLSINMHGSDVDVVIKEKEIKPELLKVGEPCNIVAACDGQIERLETFKGISVVNIGDVVSEGQLLISGIVEGMSGGNEFVCAEGKIYAKTFRVLTERLKINQDSYYDTGNMLSDKRLEIFNFEIPLNFEKKNREYINCRHDDYEKEFYIFKTKLPIKFISKKMYEQRQAIRTLSEEDATEKLKNLINEKERNEFGEKIKIINKEWGNIKKNDETKEYIQECRYECVEDISKKEEILLEKEV